jgi:hypothetical protein
MVQPVLEVLQAQLANKDNPRIALRAAAILLRFAAPGRRMLEQPTPQQQAVAKQDALWRQVKASIDGPEVTAMSRIPRRAAASIACRPFVDDHLRST